MARRCRLTVTVAAVAGRTCFAVSRVDLGLLPQADPAQTMACIMMEQASVERVPTFIDQRAPNWRD